MAAEPKHGSRLPHFLTLCKIAPPEEAHDPSRVLSRLPPNSSTRGPRSISPFIPYMLTLMAGDPFLSKLSLGVNVFQLGFKGVYFLILSSRSGCFTEEELPKNTWNIAILADV